MEKYLSLEFFLVLASVILIIALPKILIKISKRSRVGFVISIVIVGIIVISVVAYFVYAYNIRNSLEGQNYIYGRIVRIESTDEFVVNSTKGTYQSGSIGYLKIKIDKNTAVYSDNIFKKIDTVEVGDFVTVVCKEEEIVQNKLTSIKVIKKE